MVKSFNNRQNFNDRTAIRLTNLGGSMPFFWTIVIIYGSWIVYNWLAPTPLRFDGQWFPLLLFLSNFIQLIFLPILQVGQNFTNAKGEERAQRQLETIEKIEELTVKIEYIVEKQIKTEDSIVAELHLVHGDIQKDLEASQAILEEQIKDNHAAIINKLQ